MGKIPNFIVFTKEVKQYIDSKVFIWNVATQIVMLYICVYAIVIFNPKEPKDSYLEKKIKRNIYKIMISFSQLLY